MSPSRFAPASRSRIAIGLAATAGPQGEDRGLERLVLDAVGIVPQVLIDQRERPIAVGRPALAQEQRDAGPVGPGLVARQSDP